MYKFNWRAEKAMDFLILKKPTIKLRKKFFNQLKFFEKILEKEGKKLSDKWHVMDTKRLTDDELLATNTYRNSVIKLEFEVKIFF